MPLIIRALAAGAPVPITARVGFEQNKGQFRDDVLYALRPGAYLTAKGLVLSPDQVSIEFEGGNPAARVSPSDTLPYPVNVFSGSDPQKWITGIQRFGRVQYTAVYPGIDVVFAAEPFLAFRFVISAGADVSIVRLNFDGAQVTAGAYGDSSLLIWLKFHRIGQNSTAYQDTPAGRVSVDVRYTFLGTNRFGFALGTYDTAQPVVIESSLPVAGSAGFPGVGLPTVLAPSGALYAASSELALIMSGTSYDGASTPVGEICGLNFFNGPRACRDVAILKYSSAGDLVYVSYLHGTADEMPSAIAVDGADAVYITGQTNSADFPVTPGASQGNYSGPPAPFSREQYPLTGDVFIVKLDSFGKLLYSTYLGGPDQDSATTIHLDSSGNAYIGGPSSAGLPATSGALKSTPRIVAPAAGVNAPPRPCALGYIAKIDPTGRVAFLTYLPSAPATFTVDGQGNTYFGGSATGDLPVTPGTYQTRPSGDKQAFLAKLDPSGSSLTYATYYTDLGATGLDRIAIDSLGNAWFSGSEGSGVETSWIDNYLHPFLAKINSGGSKILYQTPFIGGKLAVDSDDNLSVYTQGYGSAAVRTPGGVLTSACAPVTISKLAPNGTVLLNRPVSPWNAVGLTSDGNLLTHTYQPVGVEVIPIVPAPSPDSSCVLNAASLSMPNNVAPGEIVTIFGRGLGPRDGVAFALNQQGRVPSSAGGAQVLFDGVPVPVLYASDGQVNAIAPFSLNAGSNTVIQVEYQGRTTPTISVTVTDTAPAFFSRDASGSGQILAFNQDGTLNSPGSPAQLGSIITLFATGTGITAPASIEGAVATSTDAKPVTTPSIILGGVAGGFPTEILYAGPSPGSLTGITQINLRLPDSLASADSTFPSSQWPILFSSPKITQLLTIALRK